MNPGKIDMKAGKLLEYMLIWFDELPNVKVYRKCPLIEHDHANDPRVFAHVFHRRGKVICVCKDFDKLELGHKIGVLLHEIGHLMSNGGEAEADLWVQDNLGIDIDYKNTVQWVAPHEFGL